MGKVTAKYHEKSELAECHSCGEIKLCTVHIADYPESETGYVDEYAICWACETDGGEASRGEE